MMHVGAIATTNITTDIRMIHAMGIISNPVTQVHDSLNGFFTSPEDHPPRWLLVITAYLDESGQEQEDGRMVIAGFAGNEDQWRGFATEWQKAIAPRKHLHVTDLRFKKDRERHTLKRAGGLPEKFGLMPLAASIQFSDYSDLIVGTEDEHIYPGYLACLQILMIQVLKGLPEGETLEVVFEQQDRYFEITNMAMHVFSMAQLPHWRLKDGRSKLAKWGWVAKGYTLLTEPADYFAYALLQIFRDSSSTKAKWCSPILPKDGNAYGYAVTRSMARRMVTRAQDISRSQGLWK